MTAPSSFPEPSSGPKNYDLANELRMFAESSQDNMEKIDKLLNLAQKAMAELECALKLLKKP